MQRIDAVIFDCDGVLIDSEIISATMLKDAAANYGVSLTIDYILETYVGRAYPKVLADIQSQFNITLPDNFEAQYRERLLEALERDLKLMPGIKSLISALDCPFCVATSSSPVRVARSLQLVDLWNTFAGRIYTASEVKHGKPAPDLFLHAAAKLGVAAEHCLVIEDSVAGIQAGLAASMHTVRFTGGTHITDKNDPAGADAVFDNFEHFYNHYPLLFRAQ
ncbi:MAG: HAD family hydrolase [Gammaproteobacteria bacterium]|nr:HAD family hydrolase [Gammaproteobacteria bacterium]